jgi:hypothetical protein
MLLTDIKIGLLNPLKEICKEPQIPSQFVWNIGKGILTSAHSFVTQMHLMLKKFFIWVRKRFDRRGTVGSHHYVDLVFLDGGISELVKLKKQVYDSCR